MKTLEEKFLELISKIKNPVTFFGIARVLKVELYEDVNHKKGRDFASMLEDVMANFTACNRKRKKELIKLLKNAIKEE